jgi:hypothetical protein
MRQTGPCRSKQHRLVGPRGPRQDIAGVFGTAAGVLGRLTRGGPALDVDVHEMMQAPLREGVFETCM